MIVIVLVIGLSCSQSVLEKSSASSIKESRKGPDQNYYARVHGSKGCNPGSNYRLEEAPATGGQAGGKRKSQDPAARPQSRRSHRKGHPVPRPRYPSL